MIDLVGLVSNLADTVLGDQSGAAFRFADPWFLLLLVVPLIVLMARPRRPGAAFSGYTLALTVLQPSRGPLLWKLLATASLGCLVVALARPQWGREVTLRTAEGRDLMLVIDLSYSMVTDDMFAADGERIDRLAAVVDAAKRFVAGRGNDRIGLVVFANTATSSCPLTYDHATLRRFLDQIEAQQRRAWSQTNTWTRQPTGILGNGTNLGLGIGIALRSLTDATAEGRALIAITDGKDTRELPNWVDPVEAAQQARSLGVRVYAIGVGDADGTMSDPGGGDLFGRRRFRSLPPEFLPDMQRLHHIAEAGDGLAMRANDREELLAIFARLDELEPSPHEVEVREDYADRFWWPLAAGLALGVLVLVLEPRLRGVPA